MPPMRHCLIAVALMASGVPASAQSAANRTIAAAIADAGRPPADVARDADRHPATMLAFAGVRPGMTVAELAPGGGYYTRLLAKAVGPKGHVYAISSAGGPQRPGAMDNLKAIAAAYGNITLVSADMKSFTVPTPVDLVWTSENYHDFHNGPTADIGAFNRNVAAALKRGGAFYVEDHADAAGAGLKGTSTLHRIEPAAVRSEIAAAGLKLAGESKALANPADNHTLPVFDASLRGKTDRFALLFRKP